MQPNWSTACLDWQERIVAGESLVPFEPLFPDEAQEALNVFKSLRIVDAPGQPTFGEACDEWVFDFVRAIFGAYDANTGVRLINEFFLLISKKNAKSTLAAAIMITALVRNWRNYQELMILAPTIEVAENSFGPAVAMVEADPELIVMMNVQTHKRTITNINKHAVLKVVAADPKTSAGKKAGFILVDELWLFGKQADASKMLREAIGGLVSRKEGFVIWLTTHSDERPMGIMKDKLDWFRGVRDGDIDAPNCLGILYEFPPAMIENKDYLKPENFYVTNPNIDRSVSRDWLLQELHKVQMNGENNGELQIFLAKHLNLEIGQRLSRDRWRGVDYWEGAADPEKITLDSLLVRSDVITIGVDGGGLDDMLGLSLIGRDKTTKDWLLWSKAWIHQDAYDQRKSNQTFYDEFAKNGDLVICDQSQQDVLELAEIVEEANQAGLLPEKYAVGLDPVGVAAITSELMARGLEQDQLVAVPQGYKLSGIIKGAERRLKDGRLWHDGSEMMAWVVSNARTELRGSATLITKQVSGVAKIDPLIAAFNAFSLMQREPEATGDKGITIPAGYQVAA